MTAIPRKAKKRERERGGPLKWQLDIETSCVWAVQPLNYTLKTHSSSLCNCTAAGKGGGGARLSLQTETFLCLRGRHLHV